MIGAGGRGRRSRRRRVLWAVWLGRLWGVSLLVLAGGVNVRCE